MESVNKKKKKRQIRYNILLVPDAAAAEIKKFTLSQRVVKCVIILFCVIFSLIVAYSVYLSNTIMHANSSIQNLQNTVNSLEKEKETLTNENKELTEKVSILSDTINEQVEVAKNQEKELAEKMNPTGYPMKGTASYEETKAEDDHPIVVFTSGQGTSVIATGEGVVSDIIDDAVYGHCVVIDHGNGYKSYYRNLSTPKVAVGDTVNRSTVLYDIITGAQNLGYQITLDNQFINPLDVMEIYG